jgi:RNA polymerase sigma-70 factor (ECF subfamily)
VKKVDIDKLVVKAKSGDTVAFGQIYDELLKPVYRYIYYRVEDAIAEDLTEETFLRAWQNLKKYKKGKHPFSSWVFKIAHNLVVDYYRKNRVITEIDEHMADPNIDRNPAHQADVKLTNVRLRKVIRKLPDNHQQVIILKYINELSNSEVADAMGKSEGAIRTLQFRALQELRTLMKNERFNY